MGFYGTDQAENSAAGAVANGPQLGGTQSIESQATSLSRQQNKVDDLTFRERSVRDVSDRGRMKVMEDIMRSLAVGVKREREQQRAQKAGQTSQVEQDICSQVARLQEIRSSARDPAAAAEPLRRLAATRMDGLLLRKTKVALELNQDFWKRCSSLQVKQMVVTLVKDWRAVYRKEEDGPSERTLRNAAADLENSTHVLAPRTAQYSNLVNALLGRLEQVPSIASSIIDGRQGSLDLVTKVNNRFLAEKKNAGNKPSEVRNPSAPPPEKRLRLEDAKAPW
jgi:hypothetical protein